MHRSRAPSNWPGPFFAARSLAGCTPPIRSDLIYDGHKQMLAIGRAIMSKPRLMMFDYPSLGLAPNIVEQVFEIIDSICKSGTTILMVEQNAYAALEMCDYAYLMEAGSIVLSGRGGELIDDKHIREAYLGC
jgi:branched-chain amino acid transport system ATP-binding protein